MTRVLLIEDNAADARLVQEYLREAGEGDFQLEFAVRLDEAREKLGCQRYDVILLDLGLPDARDTASTLKSLQNVSDVPLVVITGAGREGAAEESLRLGASDYMLKRELSPRVLTRAIRYASARHALAAAELERDWLEGELRALERFTGLLPTPITARMYGQRRLREAAPEVFDTARQVYAELLEAAVEASVFGTNASSASPIRDLAAQLARCFAGPGDVVDVHTAALSTRTAGATRARALAYVSEGRLLLLELMGRVLTVYRSGSLFAGPPTPAGGREPLRDSEALS